MLVWVSVSVSVSGVWQGPGPPPSRQAAGDQGPSVARDPPRGSKWDDTPVVVIFVVEVGLRLTLALTGCHPEGRLTQREGSTPARPQARMSARTHTHTHPHASPFGSQPLLTNHHGAEDAATWRSSAAE